MQLPGDACICAIAGDHKTHGCDSLQAKIYCIFIPAWHNSTRLLMVIGCGWLIISQCSANVLIFPALEVANSGDTIAQLMGEWANGRRDCDWTFLQGSNKPVNELSRGCSIDDIIATSAMTAVQAQRYSCKHFKSEVH